MKYDIDKKRVGERLAELRGRRSQSEVADAVGISPAALSMYEQGERMPRDEIKIRLADYYKKPIQSIFFAKEVDKT